MSEEGVTCSNDVVASLVDEIAQRRLIAPAIFLLELSKPLTGCMRELCVGIGDGLLRFALGERFTSALSDVLRSSEDVEALITRLESIRDSSDRKLSPRRV